ncbi:PREDICTED: NSFL1 cofactor p47-like [Amphimedon queenslandica]|uniref:UBX domain-containing protein n=1 Tax=Amphimedon queenslandica TaxID=400682 RepID=A0AAN0JFT0_AMPQE|nr:PREDICTED: NSFL1 cofactor p47-like [Amphimedon queenslandica]|eukprot:XP_019855814.1 PREDICTED: NSFL1 cofactor p47-like [Amphimedon queenslandica]
MAPLQVHFQVDTVDLNKLKDDEKDLQHQKLATIAQCKNEIYQQLERINTSFSCTCTPSKVASLSDYTSSEGTKDDEGQSFFAGGSEHSGQLISGPPRKKKDLAKDVFDAAKKQGAVPVEDMEKLRENDRKFTGTGFRLGDTEGPSDYVPGIRVTIGKEKVTKKLVFWRNGFTVDDGPLRTGQTPQDRQFLESVSKGCITPNLIDASVPPVAASSSTGTSSMVVVDHTKPVTSVQIRLADGQRLVGKFNHTHTVADIRQFITDSHPEMKNKNFVLLTTFPNRTLSEVSLSLAEANLLNAVVVQRFT